MTPCVSTSLLVNTHILAACGKEGQPLLDAGKAAIGPGLGGRDKYAQASHQMMKVSGEIQVKRKAFVEGRG